MGKRVRIDEPVYQEQLPKLLPKLKKGGITEQVQGAGLCASFLAANLAELELDAEYAQDEERKAAGWTQGQGSVAHHIWNAIRQREWLTKILTFGVWSKLAQLHEHPVRVGMLVAASYIEISLRWSDRWISAIEFLEFEERPLGIGEDDAESEVDRMALTDQAWERWKKVSARHPLEMNHAQIREIILVGIAMEENTFGGVVPQILPAANFVLPEIPADRRTRAMTLAEAGKLLGLESKNKNPMKRREAAAKAMKRRLLPNGEIRFQKLSANSYIFDKTQVPGT